MSEGPIEEEITVLNGEVVHDGDRNYNLTIDDIYDQIKSMYDYDVEQSKKDPLDSFYKIIDAIYHSVKLQTISNSYFFRKVLRF